MKKIFAAILLLSIVSFAQSSQRIQVLKNDINKDAKIVSLNNQANLIPSKKNVMFGILLSLVLPGMGELYADNYQSGKYFTIADGALWGTYLGINAYAGWQKDRYKSYAVSNGGINPEGKNDDYYAIISEYTSIYDYNDDMAKQREFSQLFNENTQYWKWEPNERKKYREMWVSSEQSYNNLRFIVGGLILNRVVSAINAVRLISRYNKNLSQETSWNISTGINNAPTLPPSFTLNFQTTF